LKNANGSKFIITYHIYPGSQYWASDTYLVYNQWLKNKTEIYREILAKYHSSILFEVGAHDHRADFRFSNQVYTPNYASSPIHNMIISPSISPGFGNNPGYLVF
jgi:hypothetical protein